MLPDYLRECGVREQADFVTQLRLTPNHFVYISDAADRPFTTRRPVPASEVRPGDHVWVATEEGPRPADAAAAVKTTHVISVRQVVDSGLVNPFTLQGAPLQTCGWSVPAHAVGMMSGSS